MVAALAFMPIAALTFGVLATLIAVIPGATDDVGLGGTLLYGAAALSVLVSIPLAWMAARRMTLARERRRLGG